MTRITRSVALVVGLVAAAGLAVAADERGNDTGGLPGRRLTGPAGTSAPGASAIGAADPLGANNCAHEMTGTVRKLDAAAGTVSVDVAGRDMVLRLPPSELEGFKEGDEVVVSLGVRELPAAVPPGERDLDPSRGIGRTTP
jgi:hypothetical protein